MRVGQILQEKRQLKHATTIKNMERQSKDIFG